MSNSRKVRKTLDNLIGDFNFAFAAVTECWLKPQPGFQHRPKEGEEREGTPTWQQSVRFTFNPFSDIKTQPLVFDFKTHKHLVNSGSGEGKGGAGDHLEHKQGSADMKLTRRVFQPKCQTLVSTELKLAIFSQRFVPQIILWTENRTICNMTRQSQRLYQGLHLLLQGDEA